MKVVLSTKHRKFNLKEFIQETIFTILPKKFWGRTSPELVNIVVY
jgi:hypothetical protein